MRKTDLLIILVLAAGGAAYQHRATQAPPLPTQSARHTVARGHLYPTSYEFAGLPLGATQAEAKARLGAPTEQFPHDNGPSKTGNWIYKIESATLDLYWVDGRLAGIQSSGQVSDTEVVPSRHWTLFNGLGFGATKEEISACFGTPAQVRKGDVETWNYFSGPGEPAVELAVAFHKGKLLHLRMSEK